MRRPADGLVGGRLATTAVASTGENAAASSRGGIGNGWPIGGGRRNLRRMRPKRPARAIIRRTAGKKFAAGGRDAIGCSPERPVLLRRASVLICAARLYVACSGGRRVGNAGFSQGFPAGRNRCFGGEIRKKLRAAYRFLGKRPRIVTRNTRVPEAEARPEPFSGFIPELRPASRLCFPRPGTAPSRR